MVTPAGLQGAVIPSWHSGVSAFTVAELGRLIGRAESSAILAAYGEVMNVPGANAITPLDLYYCMAEAQIAEKMVIYLLENKLITVSRRPDVCKALWQARASSENLFRPAVSGSTKTLQRHYAWRQHHSGTRPPSHAIEKGSLAGPFQ